MPSKILTDLAPELLIHILKSSDSFADVTSLSSTSRKMFIIWKTNVDVICDAILPRTVPCYAQAQELMEAQEKAEGDEHSIFGYLSAVDRAQWMLKGADTAANAFVYFEKCVSIWVQRQTLTPGERTDFIEAYYRATTLVTLGGDSLPIRLLSSWNMLDFEQVRIVMDFLIVICDAGFQREFSAWFEGRRSDLVPAGVTRSESWVHASESLTELHSDLYELTSTPDQPSKSETFFFTFIVRGRYPDERKTNRGAALADLLKLVRKKGTRCNVTYKLSEA